MTYNHGDHDALPYSGANANLAHLCQICGVRMPSDLPEGYRWANADELEALLADMHSIPGARVIHRSFDSQGIPYHESEADIAVPS